MYVLIKKKGMPFLTTEIILELQNCANIFRSNLVIWEIALLLESKGLCKQLVLLIKFQAFS